MSMHRSRSVQVIHNANIPKGLKLLSGEEYKDNHQVEFVCPYTGSQRGILVLTNYRLYFQTIGYDKSMMIKNFDIPLGSIYKIKKINLFRDEGTYLVDISCKDMRRLWFEYEECMTTKNFLERLYKYTFPLTNGIKLFAFQYKEVFAQNGWKIYDPYVEFSRMGLNKTTNWRITKINMNYLLCETYPAILAIRGIKDNELESVASFRSKNRLPVLSWIHPKTFVSITRCSQPLIGVSGCRSKNDERYINAIRCAVSPNDRLIIVDARPLANAVVNKAKGGGYESQNAYINTDIIFVNIANIHAMRESFRKLKHFCFSPPSEEKWLSGLEDTAWLKHVKLVLAGAVLIADQINHGKSVVVHCSDGWDRTAQLTSLAMLMLDPYYRTIQGFEVLIEKEWLSFGHKFQQRYGHGDMNCSDDERSPIFVQFIDCVWQIQRQYPTAMEFNEYFLVTILNELYTCRFGTFLCNSERERSHLCLNKQTVSLWSWMNSNLKSYTNRTYDPIENCYILKPIATMHYIRLWKKYYCQWNPECKKVNPNYMTTLQLLKTQTSLMKQIDKVIDESKTFSKEIKKWRRKIMSRVK